MPDSRCWIWDSWPRELGFRIPIASGFRNPWAVFQIPKLEFQILQAKFFRKQTVLDSGFPYMGRQSFILGYFIYQWISRANSCWPTTTRKRVGPVAINIQRIVCILTMARNIFILKIRESRLLVVHERHNTAINCRHQDTLYLKNANSSYLCYLFNSNHDYTNTGNHHMFNSLEALTVSVC